MAKTCFENWLWIVIIILSFFFFSLLSICLVKRGGGTFKQALKLPGFSITNTYSKPDPSQATSIELQEHLQNQNNILREERNIFREERDNIREERDNLREERDSLRQEIADKEIK